MRPILARIPLIGRPFYQLDVDRQERDRALVERDAAIKERDALRLALDNPLPGPSGVLNGARASGAVPLPARSCVFCNNKVDAWLPFKDCSASDFLLRIATIGSNVKRFWCPHCSSIDRERHLHLFLERLRIMEPIRGGSVLHMAPEPRLRQFIMNFDLATYVQGDLFPPHESIQRIDMQKIPFPDETFDMVICNHILEHVDDAVAAMREMHRVLKPGGRTICQTPFASRLTNTLEDPRLQSQADRLFFYGQEDHVRLFGSDIEQWFRTAGFVGRLVPHEEILPEVDPELAGINEKEPFFDFVRG